MSFLTVSLLKCTQIYKAQNLIKTIITVYLYFVLPFFSLFLFSVLVSHPIRNSFLCRSVLTNITFKSIFVELGTDNFVQQSQGACLFRKKTWTAAQSRQLQINMYEIKLNKDSCRRTCMQERRTRKHRILIAMKVFTRLSLAQRNVCISPTQLIVIEQDKIIH